MLETDWLPSTLPLLHLHILIHRRLLVELGFRGGFNGGDGAIPRVLRLWDDSQVLHRLHGRIPSGTTVKASNHTLVQVRRQVYSFQGRGRTKPDFDRCPRQNAAVSRVTVCLGLEGK